MKSVMLILFSAFMMFLVTLGGLGDYTNLAVTWAFVSFVLGIFVKME